MILRLFLCIGLVLIAVAAPTIVFALCACAYALRYTAYELVCIAAAIDAYYGAGTIIPYYTLCACAGLLIIEWIKPRISLYNEAS